MSTNDSASISASNLENSENSTMTSESKPEATTTTDKMSNGLQAPREGGVKADAVPAAIKEALRKYKVKVDGEELEVDEETLVSDYQTKRAADKRFQEAARLRKSAEEVIHLLKTDPRAALRHPAIQADERKLAEAILSEQLEEELLDPKDRQIRALEKRLRDGEAAEAKSRQETEAAAATAAEAQYVEQYQASIRDALVAGGLPLTNSTVRSMSSYLQNALEAGYDLAPKDVIKLVKEDYHSQLKELFSAADATTITELLGEDGLKKVRGIDIARLKNPQQLTPTPPPEEQGTPKERKAAPKQKVSDFFSDLKKGLK